MKIIFRKCVFDIFDCVMEGALLLSLTEIMYYSDVLSVIPPVAIIPLFMETLVALPRRET